MTTRFTMYLNRDLTQKPRRQPQAAAQDAPLKSTRAVPRRIRGHFRPPAVRHAA